MAKTVHWALESEEALLHAVRRRAAREGLSPSDVVNGILSQALAAELDEVSGATPLADVIQNVMDAGARAGTPPPQGPP